MTYSASKEDRIYQIICLVITIRDLTPGSNLVDKPDYILIFVLAWVFCFPPYKSEMGFVIVTIKEKEKSASLSCRSYQ